MIRTYERDLVVPGAKLVAMYKGLRLACIVSDITEWDPGFVVPDDLRRKTARDNGWRFMAWSESNYERPAKWFRTLHQATRYARGGEPANPLGFWTIEREYKDYLMLARNKLADEYALRATRSLAGLEHDAT